MSDTQINATINAYMDAFNAGDLNRVMTFFSDDAIYEPGDGKTHRESMRYARLSNLSSMLHSGQCALMSATG